MSKLVLDLAESSPEQAKAAIDAFYGVDAGAVNEEVLEAIASVEAELKALTDSVYKVGQSIEVDRIQADFIDIDVVDEEYNVDLYNEAVAIVDRLLALDPERSHLYIAHLGDLTGDDEVRKGRKDHVYKEIIDWAENAIDANL